MLKEVPKLKMRIVLCHTDAEAGALREAGVKSIKVVRKPEDVYCFVPSAGDYQLDREFEHYSEIILAFPRKEEDLRDAVAVRLGDRRCRWIDLPKDLASVASVDNARFLADLVEQAKPMWTDEVCTIDDIPEPGPQQTFKCGFDKLDEHGFRLVRPAFMPVVGPYGSGKSVLLRQLSVNLWRLHGWKILITAFEERVKPRIQRDLRRHLIGHNMREWTPQEIIKADDEIQRGFRFLRRPRDKLLDAERFLSRVEYAVQVYGVDVVILDPVNELDHVVEKGENKSDYMGRFIMRCKQLADDYNLLFIAALHPPKEAVARRMNMASPLTLNDGEDTRHWGNKADIGWCVWRPSMKPDAHTYLHNEKLKDHETMGKPTLCELLLDTNMNAFSITRMGYDTILKAEGQ